MKFRTTLIALLLFVLAGVFVYVFEVRWAREKKERQDEAKKIFSLDWADVRALRLTGSHGTLVLQRKEPEADATAALAGQGSSGWRIVEPVLTDADDASIGGLMTALKDLEQEQVVDESPADLEPFGLREPRLRVAFVLAEGKQAPAPLLVGGKSPVGENSYARKEGENAVLLLNEYADPKIDKSLFDLREKRIFRADKGHVERVEIFREGRLGLDMVRQEDRWNLVEPIRAPVSREEADKLLDKIVGLRARSFENEPAETLARYGLEKPLREVRLTLAPEQTRASLLVGASLDEDGLEMVYAKRGETPQVVKLDRDLLGTLDVDPETLRDRKVFPFQSWKVDKVVMGWNGQDLTLVKSAAGKWRITRPMEARADSGAVAAFLSFLSRLEGNSFLHTPADPQGWRACGLEDPLARVTLYEGRGTPAGGQPPEDAGPPEPAGTLLLGKPDGAPGRGYAWLEGASTVAEIGDGFFREQLPENAEAFRDRRVLDFHRYEVAAVEFRGPQGDAVLQEEDGVWKLKKPVSRPVDATKAEELIGFLSDLKLERFLDGREEAVPEAARGDPFGLDPPLCRITLKTEQGEELATALFSAGGPPEEPQGRYVGMQGNREVGVVGQDRVEELLEKVRGIQGTD